MTPTREDIVTAIRDALARGEDTTIGPLAMRVGLWPEVRPMDAVDVWAAIGWPDEHVGGQIASTPGSTWISDGTRTVEARTAPEAIKMWMEVEP
jgi:hypothetical protein